MVFSVFCFSFLFPCVFVTGEMAEPKAAFLAALFLIAAVAAMPVRKGSW